MDRAHIEQHVTREATVAAEQAQAEALRDILSHAGGGDSADAPWTVVKSDCKKRARLNAMRYVLHRLPYNNKDLEQIGRLDPLIIGRAALVNAR